MRTREWGQRKNGRKGGEKKVREDNMERKVQQAKEEGRHGEGKDIKKEYQRNIKKRRGGNIKKGLEKELRILLVEREGGNNGRT